MAGLGTPPTEARVSGTAAWWMDWTGAAAARGDSGFAVPVATTFSQEAPVEKSAEYRSSSKRQIKTVTRRHLEPDASHGRPALRSWALAFERLFLEIEASSRIFLKYSAAHSHPHSNSHSARRYLSFCIED